MAARERLPPWHERMRLPNGREVLIRPIRPEDAEPIRASFPLLGPDEVRRRFLFALSELTPDMADRLTRINPKTAANKVSLLRLERLVPEIKATLTAAIAKGGSTLRDFIHSDGSSGYFQQEYFVYGRDGLPCRVCGATIKRIVQGQRATFYCPVCQR